MTVKYSEVIREEAVVILPGVCAVTREDVDAGFGGSSKAL